jgi:hypothetical protein
VTTRDHFSFFLFNHDKPPTGKTGGFGFAAGRRKSGGLDSERPGRRKSDGFGRRRRSRSRSRSRSRLATKSDSVSRSRACAGPNEPARSRIPGSPSPCSPSPSRTAALRVRFRAGPGEPGRVSRSGRTSARPHTLGPAGIRVGPRAADALSVSMSVRAQGRPTSPLRRQNPHSCAGRLSLCCLHVAAAAMGRQDPGLRAPSFCGAFPPPAPKVGGGAGAGSAWYLCMGVWRYGG